MAKRQKVGIMDEIRELSEEQKIRIIGPEIWESIKGMRSDSIDALRYSQESGRSMGGYATEGRIYIIGEGMREELEEVKEIRWKTTRVEAKSRTIDPRSALLEAEPGPDGTYRVEREGIQEEELERLRVILGKGMQEEINRLIRGAWDVK